MAEDQHSVPSSLFFEGTEKKVEIVLAETCPPWRRTGSGFWEGIVEAAGAQVLSRISNDRCDAYVLSESSLFVFDHKMILITCGRTHLPAAVLALLRDIDAAQVAMLAYERKNEVFPHGQPSSFFDDVDQLDAVLPGRAYQFGEEDGHHLYLFHLDREFEANPGDATLEILMHDIDPARRTEFGGADASGPARVRELIESRRLVEGFQIDDHLFEPGGYSLNAIRDEHYLTVHVTPEEICSYVSVETNYPLGERQQAAVFEVLETFRPRSYDLIAWAGRAPEHGPAPGYRLKTHVAERLSCGYEVRHQCFYRPRPEQRPAVALPIRRRQPGPTTLET